MQGGAALGLRNSRKGKREQEIEKNNEDLINFLESKLEEIEKKLTSTQNVSLKGLLQEYEILQKDYSELQDKLVNSREKYKKSALILTEYLDELLTATPQVMNNEADMHLNLDKIKETPLQELDNEDRIALILVLLK